MHSRPPSSPWHRFLRRPGRPMRARIYPARCAALHFHPAPLPPTTAPATAYAAPAWRFATRPPVAAVAAPGVPPMISCGWCARRGRVRPSMATQLPTAPSAFAPRFNAPRAVLLFLPLTLSTTTTLEGPSFVLHVPPYRASNVLLASVIFIATNLRQKFSPASCCATSASSTVVRPALAAALYFLLTGHMWAPTMPRGARRAACYSTLPYAADAPAPGSCATPQASPTASRTVRRASLRTRVPGTRATTRTTALLTRMIEALELTMPRRRRPPTRATRAI
jgi:hypothetical protein